MAIKSNAVAPSSMLAGLSALARPVQAATPAKEERVASKIWMNVGYVVAGVNGDDQFVSLPYGVAIDTMQPRDVPVKQGAFRALRIAQNTLLEQLQAAGAQLEPGQSVYLPYGEGSVLIIELRRAGEEEGITEEDGALVKDLGLFAPK